MVARFIGLSLLGIAASTSVAAQAQVVEVRFSRPQIEPQRTFQDFGPNIYHTYQNAFRNQADTNGVTWDFRFTYDPSSNAPNYGLAVTTARLGSFVDFSLFTPSMTLARTAG